MSDTTMKTQAALIFDGVPEVALEEIRIRINKALGKRGYPEFELGSGASDSFVLFRNPQFHATIAIHKTPLGLRGQERAAASPVVREKEADFAQIAQTGPAHILICVGEGPEPLSFDQPAPVETKIKLEVLLTLIRLVMRQARPVAAHLCTSDMFYTADDLDAAFSGGFPPSILVHPVETTKQTGPDGDERPGLILYQSEHLIGKTLVLEGVPASVPLDMSLSLADTIIRQHMKGTLPLADGDTLSETVGMELYVRHAEPDAAFPGGRIVASFWPSAPDGGAMPGEPFPNHPGYAAVPATPGSDTSSGETGDGTWVPPSPGSSYAPDGSSKRRSSGWMILVGIGLFLWIGLPLLNIPKAVLEATFSEGLNNEPASRELPQNN